MLGTRVGSIGADPWPDGVSIDSVLGPWSGEHYREALFIVSQIVSDHGFEGLATLWHALSPESGAAELRAEYERHFGRPLDSLVEPVLVGSIPNARFSCFYEICLPDSRPIDEAAGWTARGPESCDDEGTIGPRPWDGALAAWTHHTVEVGASTPSVVTSGGEGAVLRYCGLGCSAVPHEQTIPPGTSGPSMLPPGRYLVEVGHRASELPTSEAATLRFELP